MKKHFHRCLEISSTLQPFVTLTIYFHLSYWSSEVLSFVRCAFELLKGVEKTDCIAEIHSVNNLTVLTMAFKAVFICAMLVIVMAAMIAEAQECTSYSFTYSDVLECYNSCSRACQRVACEAIGCNENVCYCKW
ncbi:unnamed protein product [Callosobruchus maculatus]|uniref:Uncharacterized protein n=1 Tax=Callosobruchus maculatus TaxID=64391 RepID=A0A653D0V1_CALMS|nr:unnamed protein product [Callosobruchus maculatus]